MVSLRDELIVFTAAGIAVGRTAVTHSVDVVLLTPSFLSSASLRGRGAHSSLKRRLGSAGRPNLPRRKINLKPGETENGIFFPPPRQPPQALWKTICLTLSSVVSVIGVCREVDPLA